MTRQRWIPTLIGLALLAVALPLALISRAKETPVPERSDLRRVEVAAVTAADAATDLRFSGVLRAEDRAGLSFSTGGRLLSRPVEVGERVKKGQEIARIDARDLANGADAAASALAELEARAAQAARERQRVERLSAASAATDEELEQARTAESALEAAVASAQTRLKEARRALGEGVLEAPFGGTVTDVYLEPGEYADAGAPVVGISGDGALEVEVGVPEGLLLELEEGAEVSVELPLAAGEAIPGTIRSVGRAAVGRGHLFPVIVGLGPPEGPSQEQPRSLAPGMTAEVVLSHRQRSALALPLTAVVNPGASQPAVFRIADGKAERVPVEVEQLAGEKVTVSGPLAAGDEVVVRGHGNLLDGEAVEVLR